MHSWMCNHVTRDWTAGHVGTPVACNFVKLEDVADINYFSVNNKGEIFIKGNNVFQGYLKDPEKTQEALDKDGWLHTGDIGGWLPNGTLKIIDWKKNIFKLAQGEYIAPEKIENVYNRSRPVLQVFIHGESLVPEPFSIENGLLMPTLKVKRVELAKFFQTQIKSLYESIQE
ncbi:Long-chain-fatty-acid--CoA ligase 5 [Cricetulus griseus]|uniref:long-chain-fatty-acid--CoA ligase n=1 Tax=Cricetulus griseus TaxID=10029 RepID=G3HNS8_CRIGR|nr:Long-chain-fatty-acid--CoA ligase 5 [Cricetulus griseus]